LSLFLSAPLFRPSWPGLSRPSTPHRPKIGPACLRRWQRLTGTKLFVPCCWPMPFAAPNTWMAGTSPAMTSLKPGDLPRNALKITPHLAAPQTRLHRLSHWKTRSFAAPWRSRKTKPWLIPESSVYFRLIETLCPARRGRRREKHVRQESGAQTTIERR
jgi:hypothetical protein